MGRAILVAAGLGAAAAAPTAWVAGWALAAAGLLLAGAGLIILGTVPARGWSG